MKLKRQLFVFLWNVGAERVSKIPEYACVHRYNWFIQYKTCLTHPKSWMIGRSKELEDVGRVASSFPTYLGKIEATLLAGYTQQCPMFFDAHISSLGYLCSRSMTSMRQKRVPSHGEGGERGA